MKRAITLSVLFLFAGCSAALADDSDARARAALAGARANADTAIEQLEKLKANLKALDDATEELRREREGRPTPGGGFRPAPLPVNATIAQRLASPVDRPAVNTDGVRVGGARADCENGCCDEKAGKGSGPGASPARKAVGTTGDNLLASINGGRGADLPWRDAARLSKTTHRPLLEWVGDELCPRCVDDTAGEFVHYFTPDAGRKAVSVWLPSSDGHHYRIGTLTKWVEGSPRWGHAASARKVIAAHNAGRATTLEGWAAPDVDPSMGLPPDSPMRGRTTTVAMHDPFQAQPFRDPAFVVTPAPATHVPAFAPPPVFRSAPMMSGGCSGGSCGSSMMMRSSSSGGCSGGSCGSSGGRGLFGRRR